jgi:adenylyltransferase/sulfurtransferase
MNDRIPRHHRHTLLKKIGPEGQERIEKARVLVAGLGALGSLIAMLLARAGVGFLRIVDMDTPELHNLHRQLLYDEADLERGLSKAEQAEERLIAANSEIQIEAVTAAVGPDNIDRLTEGIDLVVDALDNMRTRYVINDAIVDKGIPFVFGGAIETSGNVMTIIPGKTPCLRCLWPDPESVTDHRTAAEVGVLSAAATMVASVETTEAMKILVGKEDEILSGLLVMDVWNDSFRVAPVEPDPSCRCRNRRQ